jgi:hypothetical protein
LKIALRDQEAHLAVSNPLHRSLSWDVDLTIDAALPRNDAVASGVFTTHRVLLNQTLGLEGRCISNTLPMHQSGIGTKRTSRD